MFPDLARDDVFRLETPRLWLRWPRVSDAAAIHRFCSLWEVARYTARIPHPYPPGSAERFIYAARQGNASGRDLTLVDDADQGQARRDRLDQPRDARRGPPGARLRARAGGLGQGPRHGSGPGDGRGRLRASPRRSRSWRASRSRTRPRAACLKSAVSTLVGDRAARRAGARRHGRLSPVPPGPRGVGRGRRAAPQGVRRSGARARDERAR